MQQGPLLTPEDVRAFVAEKLAEVQAARAAAAAHFQGDPAPPPPTEPPPFVGNWLDWQPSSYQPRPPAQPLAMLWASKEIEATMQEYILRDPVEAEQPNAILGVMLAAGGGKTTSGVRVAQWAAAQGIRVLWVSGSHRAWEDVSGSRDFDPDQWYHWQSLNEETCRFDKAQMAWMQKGYSAHDLCWQLCSRGGDDHMAKHCIYRGQGRTTEPIIFAMHPHLTTGLAINDFGLVIVDELPLGAFVVDDRVIPRDGLEIGATGALWELIEHLKDAVDYAARHGERLSGKALFDIIGPALTEAYRQVTLLPDMLPETPRVALPDDVRDVPYWYIFDLLALAAAETEAWAAGWETWAERVRVMPPRGTRPGGLQLLTRAPVWEYLPRRMIVLDATGKPPLYEQMFDRAMELYQPPIARVGRVFQVTRRLFGASEMTDDEGQPSASARLMLRWAKAIAAQYKGRGRVCVITHKSVRPLFDEEFGEENVGHFYNIRGSNEFEDAVCLIQAGTPAPPPSQVIDIAVALNPARIEPYRLPAEHTDDGEPGTLFTREQREFAITDDLRAANDGRVPSRSVGGYWQEPDLQAIYEQLREAEAVQALHRPRPNKRMCDVWLLSGVPTGEPLDGIGDSPSGNGSARRKTQYVSGLPKLGPDGITWDAWLQLEPWLAERWEAGDEVTTEAIAAHLKRSAKRIANDRWLDAIAGFHEDWQMGYIPNPPGKRGPRKKALIPVTDDIPEE